MNSTANLNRFLLGYLNNLVEDISADSFYLHQDQGINSPGWCLGHLAVETDDANKYLGHSSAVPENWYSLFFYTAPPLKLDQTLPSKADLIAAVNSVFPKLLDSFQALDEEFLARPCHSNFLKGKLPTENDWFVHILTTHIAMHAGNIAAWRKFSNFGPASY